jgi:uncharacterized protein (DUF1800 family)
MDRTRFTGFLIAVVLALIPAVELKGTAAESRDEATITHVLNRLTFGARPGDADRVQAIGLAAWLDQQLHPSRIDDHAAEAILPPLGAAPGSADPMELRRFARRQVETLASDKVLRAMYSERQLQEVLVDFWFNHFNVYAGKGRTAEYLPEYERDVIRPHVFDHFRELLEADAKSPAMLFYLDNWLSADPNAARRLADMRAQQTAIRNQRRLGRRGFFGGFPPSVPLPPKQPAAANNGKKKERGLNENYGRELLELHTLGVDGGYTQKDVIEVARAFTGWTIDRDGKFRFVPALHDAGEKLVLGHTIKAGGGIDDGEKVLDIIASHPSTAHHISFELAQRLVADEPPPALVDRAAARFRETNGDLREVVKTIVTSPEFVAPAVRDAKFKTPFELVVSAVRTTGATVSDARAFVQTLQQLGEPLYMCQPPTGYHDTADAWVSAGGLVTRMNFATRLASGNMPGVMLPPNAPPANELALRIGSPEFQRH